MQKLLHIFLSACILFQSLVGAFLVLSYEWQKKEIAATLCVNKNLPAKNCQGKCYLKKQLKKAEETEKKLPSCVKEKMEVVYTLHDIFQFTFFQPAVMEERSSLYSFNLPESPTYTDPHPPRV
jgi:hypothetical protein